MQEGLSNGYVVEGQIVASSKNVVWRNTSRAGAFELASVPSEKHLQNMNRLYSEQSEVAFQHNPYIENLVHRNGDVFYFTYEKSAEIHAYALVRKINRRVAEVEFGPVHSGREALLACLDELVHCVREALGVWILKLQLAGQTSSLNADAVRTLKEKFRVKKTDPKENWASSVIDVSKTDEEIRKSFSKNHKRSIKKAEKLGVVTRRLDSRNEIEAFNDVYTRMYEVRGVKVDTEQNLLDYKRLFNYFESSGNGFFFGAFDEENTLIGGMIIFKQGDYGFYHHSASDPKKRKIPVLHKAIVDVLDEIRNMGMRYFDFGGYNHMVGKEDQVYNINRFKDGFTKEYTYYPDVMYIEYIPGAVATNEIFEQMKTGLKKLVGR